MHLMRNKLTGLMPVTIYVYGIKFCDFYRGEICRFLPENSSRYVFALKNPLKIFFFREKLFKICFQCLIFEKRLPRQLKLN